MHGLVDDSEDPELATVVRAHLNQIVRPDVPRILRPQPDAGAVVQPQPAALRLALRHLQAFTPPDPLDPLVVHPPARRMQHRGHPAVTVAPVLLGQRDDVAGQRLLVIRPARATQALRRPVLAKHAAHASLGHRELSLQLVDAALTPRGAWKFPRAASCRMSLSSVRSKIARP